MTDRKKNIRILDAVNHEQALDDAEEAAKRARTPEEQASIEGLQAQSRALLRAEREKLRKQAAAATASGERQPLPSRILAMTREAIVERLRELRDLMGPDEPLAAQARKLDELSLDDLRWLLSKLEDEDDGGSGAA